MPANRPRSRGYVWTLIALTVSLAAGGAQALTPFTPNATLDTFVCDIPGTVGYLPSDGDIEIDCEIDLTISGAFFSLVYFDIHVELVSMTPSGFFLTPGTEEDSRVVAVPRFWTLFGSGTYTVSETVNLTDVDAVSGDDMESWLAEQYSLGRKVTYRVILDPDDTFYEGGPGSTDNDLIYSPFGYFDLAPLQGVLKYGDVSVVIDTGSAVRPPLGTCPLGELQFESTASGTWTPSATGGWADETISLGSDCVQIESADTTGIVLAATTGVKVLDMAGTLGGLDAVVSVALGPTGIQSLGGELILPTEHTWHRAMPGGEPTPRGERTVTFGVTNFFTTSGFGADMDEFRGRIGAGFLHPPNVPFYVQVRGIEATARTVKGRHDGAKYAYDLPFHPTDPRRPAAPGEPPGVASNDIRFGATSAPQPTTSFNLRASGLFTGLGFDSDEGDTHYPAGALGWTAFDVSMVAGDFKSGTTLPADIGFAFDQSSSCAECPNDSDGDIAYGLTPSTDVGLHRDGATAWRAEGLADPAWGTYEAAQGHIFERDGDSELDGVLMHPGFLASGTGGADNQPVVDYLLGSREVDEPYSGVLQPRWHHLRSSRDARLGNYFFAGATVGPEYLVDSSGLPSAGIGESLSGNDTSIWLGGHGQPGPCSGLACEFTDNDGSKYVVSSAGVTGVFNTDDVEDITVYGYDLPLDRFAFRMVENGVDDTTWMDGQVSIPDPGDFTIDFTSLAFDCTGDVNDGLVTPCLPSDPPTAGNCGETLGAWNTSIDLLTMGFTPTGSDDSCGGSNRILTVGSEVDLGALDEPLGLTSDWSPDGDPSDSNITGETDHILDRPASPASAADNAGMAVAFGDSVDLAHDADEGGSFIASASMGVPFWNAFDLDLRLAQDSVFAPSPTVVVEAGSVADLPGVDPSSAASLMNDALYAVQADYTWGASGFELGFQVGYQGNGSGTLAPSFVGLERSTSLVVLEINGAVDYLTPAGTKISFGASADLSARALAGIDLHVDLQDLDSIAEFDGWLNSFGISGSPLSDAIGPVVEQLEIVLDLYASFELEAVIEEQIEFAIDAAIALVPGVPAEYDDAFAYLESLVRVVESIPADIGVELSTGFDELLEAVVEPLNGAIEATVLDIYLEASVTIASGTCGAACDDILDDIHEVRGALASVNAVLDEAEDVLNLVPNRLQVVLDDADATVDTAIDLVDEVALATVGLGGFVAQFEDSSVGANVLLAALVVVVAPAVEPLLDELGILQIAADLQELADLIPFDALGLEGVDSDLQNQALELLGDLDDILAAYTVDIEGKSYSTALDDFTFFLNDTRAILIDIQAEIGGVDVETLLPVEELIAIIHDAQEIIGAADEVLAFLEDELECLNTVGCLLEIEATVAVDIQAELDAMMFELSGGSIDFGASGSFTVTIADQARLALDEAIGAVALAVNIGLPSVDLIAGLSIEGTIKSALVDLVMGSEAVETMLVDIQEYFTLLVDDVVALAQGGLDQVSAVLQDAIESASAALEAALENASAAIADVVGFNAATIDGYAILGGNELEKLHIGAEFERVADTEESETVFQAALDVTAWDTSGEGDACASGSSSALFDVVISTTNVPMGIGPSEVQIDSAELGFTLDGLSFPPTTIGIFGGITTTGGLDFESFSLYDMGLEFGMGSVQTYLGAKASAKFGSIVLSAAFLAGKTCGIDVIEKLDPQVAEYITLPGGVFNGVYARGSASFPVVDYGCLLRLSLAADLGAWVLAGPPLTVGGLVGGGASGKFACIGALAGKVTLIGEKSGDNLQFAGEGFAAAGAGLGCEPETWSSISKSRNDDWCGTGDASIKATYRNGNFSVEEPNVSAIH